MNISLFQKCAKRLHCSMFFTSISDYALRKCSEDGIWLGATKDEMAFGNDTHQENGWTNLWPCVREDLRVYCPEVIQNARVLEMVGYSLSFVSIVASLIILSAFRLAVVLISSPNFEIGPEFGKCFCQ